MSEQASLHQSALTEEDHYAPKLARIKPRVTDVDKAHTLALAANLEETNAAGIRYIGSEALKIGMDPDEFEIGANDVQLPDMYSDVKEYSGLDDPDADLTPDGLVEHIKKHQNQADRLYEFTSESYDKLKATER